jgi:hypothetical protein
MRSPSLQLSKNRSKRQGGIGIRTTNVPHHAQQPVTHVLGPDGGCTAADSIALLMTHSCASPGSPTWRFRSLSSATAILGLVELALCGGSHDVVDLVLIHFKRRVACLDQDSAIRESAIHRWRPDSRLTGTFHVLCPCSGISASNKKPTRALVSC